jgi:hypothetical protein
MDPYPQHFYFVLKRSHTLNPKPPPERKHCSEERERQARRREQQELEQAREQLATRFVGNST